MTPSLLVAELYRTQPQPRSFIVDWHLHLVTGYVFDTPRTFLMGRPVDTKADEEMISDPRVAFPKSKCDGWFIWAMAGDLTHVHDLMPFHLAYTGWMRRQGRIRWYPTNKAWRVIDKRISFGKPLAHAFV
jgi:hypothetical protein